jgi:hypothetical protein
MADARQSATRGNPDGPATIPIYQIRAEARRDHCVLAPPLTR